MTEQEKKEYETRKKIASTLLHANEIMEGHGFVFCLKIADALSAAGIGDVGEWKDKATAAELVAQAAANIAIERIEEWKHRAEVWKQATKDMIDTDICFGCRARATGVCFKQSPNPETDECMNAIYKQAEKELQEEKNE